jgi:hypothetical protein
MTYAWSLKQAISSFKVGVLYDERANTSGVWLAFLWFFSTFVWIGRNKSIVERPLLTNIYGCL